MFFSFQWHRKTHLSDTVPGSDKAKGHLRAFLTKLIKQPFAKRRMVRPNWPLLPRLYTNPHLIIWASLRRVRNEAKDGRNNGNTVPTKEQEHEREAHGDGLFRWSFLPIQTHTVISSRCRFSQGHFELEMLAGQPPSFARYPLVIFVTRTKWGYSFRHFENEEKNLEFLWLGLC